MIESHMIEVLLLYAPLVWIGASLHRIADKVSKL